MPMNPAPLRAAADELAAFADELEHTASRTHSTRAALVADNIAGLRDAAGLLRFLAATACGDSRQQEAGSRK